MFKQKLKIFSIFLPLIILAVILSGCLGGPDCSKPSSQMTQQEIFDCALAKIDSEKTGYNTPADCEKLTSNGSKSICYRTVAEKTNNLSLCEKLYDPAFDDNSGRSLCYSNAGKANNNVIGCEMASESFDKWFCYTAIAINRKNKALCNKAAEVKGETSDPGCEKQIDSGAHI